jgi:hypothetical protein
MHKTLLLAAAASAALLALAGCNNQPETVGLPHDSQAEALKNAPPVELPPAVTSNKTYRCADNSLYYVDFYNNNTAVLHRGNREAAGVTLTAEGGNPPFAGGNYSLSGNGNNVRINNQSCHT